MEERETNALADWMTGWDSKDEGRIWKLDSPVAALSAARREVRSLLAQTFDTRAAADLGVLLQHADMRVRLKAQFELVRRADVTTLRLAYRPAVAPLITMLVDNNDRDVNLRHAGSLALSRIGDASAVAALYSHGSRAVRIAAIVALRRMRHPDVARFLADADEQVVTEAARAINDDGGIEAAVPALARVLDEKRFTSEPLLRRAINANLRLGTRDAAETIDDRKH